MTKTKDILGLAFEERRVFAAEVSMGAEGPRLLRQGVFEMGVLENANAAALGQQLRQFLRRNQFAANRAVIGLPGRWIVAKQVKIPPAEEDALPGIVQIQAQRSFSMDSQELACDYYRVQQADGSSTLLLMATQSQRLTQIASLAKAAGIRVAAVMPTSHAFRMFEGDSGGDLGLYLSDGGVEFWSGRDAAPWIRHVWRPAENGEQQKKVLEEEVRRQLFMTGRDGESSRRRLTVYTSEEAEEESLERVAGAAASQNAVINRNTALSEGGFEFEDISRAGRAAGAAALALAGCKGAGLYVDFARSHKAAKRHIPRARVVRWAAILAVIAVVGLGAVAVGWRRNVRDIAAYRAQLGAMSGEIESARRVVDRMSHAANWTVRRPRFLDCLHELTAAFPDEGSVWVVSLALRENKQGLITGQALRESSVLGVLDSLKGNAAFGDVAMVYMRDAGRTTNEVSFAISFKYLAMD